MPPVTVKRTYLELTRPADLQPAATPVPEPRIERLDDCPPSFFRYLYMEVGRQYHWTDRLSWTDERARDHLLDPTASVWLLSLHAFSHVVVSYRLIVPLSRPAANVFPSLEYAHEYTGRPR